MEEILNICDVKGDDDLQVYRLNNDKAIAWLKAKVLNCVLCKQNLFSLYSLVPVMENLQKLRIFFHLSVGD